jgi:hypothetical protein
LFGSFAKQVKVTTGRFAIVILQLKNTHAKFLDLSRGWRLCGGEKFFTFWTMI